MASYNSIDGKYGIYFPCDGQTVNASTDEEDLEFLQTRVNHLASSLCCHQKATGIVLIFTTCFS